MISVRLLWSPTCGTRILPTAIAIPFELAATGNWCSEHSCSTLTIYTGVTKQKNCCCCVFINCSFVALWSGPIHGIPLLPQYSDFEVVDPRGQNEIAIDVTAAVQAFVNRPGWIAGNKAVFQFARANWSDSDGFVFNRGLCTGWQCAPRLVSVVCFFALFVCSHQQASTEVFVSSCWTKEEGCRHIIIRAARACCSVWFSSLSHRFFSSLAWLCQCRCVPGLFSHSNQLRVLLARSGRHIPHRLRKSRLSTKHLLIHARSKQKFFFFLFRVLTLKLL
jgi:hypothetical protein